MPVSSLTALPSLNRQCVSRDAHACRGDLPAQRSCWRLDRMRHELRTFRETFLETDASQRLI
jgi:hypothetical protein